MSEIVLPTEDEFNLRALFGVEPYGTLKQQLILFALEILRTSLLDHVHPFETLQACTAIQWEDENLQSPSPVHEALTALERDPQTRPLLDLLHEEAVRQRLRIEWLHEATLGRFERTVPYLHQEDRLIQDWQHACAQWKESSFNPYETAAQEAERVAQDQGLAESTRRLFVLSFLAACRKLFVHLCGARETWVGSWSLEGFPLDPALAGLLGVDGTEDASKENRLVLRFGLVDHVYYVQPPLEKLTLFAESIRHTDLVSVIQRKLCPFTTDAGDARNADLWAKVFYSVYQLHRLREMKGASPPAPDPDFLAQTGLTHEQFDEYGFVPLDPETVGSFARLINALPDLRAFLFNPRTEASLIRHRLFKVILDPMLRQVVHATMLSLCRQWNPCVKTAGGEFKPMLQYVQERANEEVGMAQPSDAAAIQTETARRIIVREELLRILEANTAQWQQAMTTDGYVVDPARDFFMTILDKAINETDGIRWESCRNSQPIASAIIE